MPAVSISASETAKKSEAVFLRALETPGKARAVAAAMGVSEAAVSRWKNEKIAELFTLCAYLGLELRPTDHVAVHPTAHEFHTWVLASVMRHAPHLLEGTEPEA